MCFFNMLIPVKFTYEGWKLEIYPERAVLYDFRGQTGYDCRTLPVSMPNFNDQNEKICGRLLKFSKSIRVKY